jgi:hypothetical protein
MTRQTGAKFISTGEFIGGMKMILSDLSLSQNASSETVKSALEEKLSQYLPTGSYTVILRSYQGDFRARSTNQASYKAMILLDSAGKQAALSHKNDLEAVGFRVSPAGEVSAN